MKIAFIASTHDMPRLHRLGQIEMALTHLFLENQQYAAHFRQAGGYVILDNSIMELGEALAGDEVLAVAKEMMPSLVVAPDKFNDRKETIHRTIDFVRKKNKMGDIRKMPVMAVAHGKDWEQWKQCFETHQKNDSVAVIGLPYGTTFQVPDLMYQNLASRTKVMMDNRLAMTAWIATKFRRPKPCHLLGASDPIELRTQKKYSFAVSHDSSSAYACGIHGVSLDAKVGLGDQEKFKMNFSDKATETQMSAIMHNISTILSWTSNAKKTEKA